MKHINKLLIGLSLLGLSSTALIGTYLHPKHVYAAKAETSADWNAPYTGSYSGTYYDSVTGTEGMTLKSQLTSIVSAGYHQIDYDDLDTLYLTSDVRPEDGTIFDMYADWHFATSKTCGNYSNIGDCYNKEHSVPKSWFGGKVYPMYSDAFHLYPTDGKVNNYRSNYAFGEVASASFEYSFKNNIQGISKLGTSALSGYNGTVFEPADCYKGDFARSYFYFATRYASKMGSISGNGTAHFTGSTTYCHLTKYSVDLFMKWHRDDPVSIKEVKRNNAVYAEQKNRNPFIDHPEYAEAIWGDTPVGKGSVKISKSSATFSVDSEGTTLSAVSSDNSQITWTSSNTSVATVSNATANSGASITVSPVSAGTSTITAKATIEGNVVSASCVVTVTKVLSSLSFTGTPTQTEYSAGEIFNPNGLVVTAQYTDSSTENVTNLVTWTPNPLTEGTTSVTGTYSGKTITVTGITVGPSKATEASITYEDIPLSYQTGISVRTSSTGIKYVAINVANYSGDMQFKKNSGKLYNTESLSLTSITLNSVSKGALTVFGSTVSAGEETTEIKSTTSTYDLSGYKYFSICEKSGTAANMDSVTIICGSTPVTKAKLTSISTANQTTLFEQGDSFMYDGTCTARYDDGSSKTVTPVVDSSKVSMNVVGNYEVTLSYTEDGITAKTSYEISVTSKEVPPTIYDIDDFTEDFNNSLENIFYEYIGQESDEVLAMILPIWEQLKNNEHFGQLSDEDKEILSKTIGDDTGSDLEKMLAMYDYFIDSYPELDDFLNRRSVTPIDPDDTPIDPDQNNGGSSNNNLIIIIIASASALVVAGIVVTILVIIKKKRAKIA